MKIALFGNVNNSLHDPLYRSVERFIENLAKKLVKRGHDVTVFTGTRLDYDCAVFPILTDRENELLGKWQKLPATNWEKMEKLKRDGHLRAFRKIASSGFDIVHNNSLDILPLLASSKLKTLMLTTLHGPPTSEHVQLFEKLKGSIHSHFCATSQHTKRVWKQRIDELEVAVIHNGVLDLEDGVSLNFKSPENKAFWVGKIRPDKGLHHAIKACHLAGVSLNFAGPVDDMDYFENTVIPLMGREDQYVGNLHRNRLRSAMENARVGLITPQDGEPLGFAPVEMLSCGLPVASYNRENVSEILNPSNGYLARPHDVEDLAFGISSIKDLCKVRIQQQTIKKYNLDTMVQKYEKVYRFLKAVYDKDRKRKAYWHLYTSQKQGKLV